MREKAETQILKNDEFGGMEHVNREPTEPQRLFTAEDYLSAARIVANCRSDRLPYVLSLLGSGGWEVNPLTNKKLPAIDTSDIAERLKQFVAGSGYTLRDLSSATGIGYDVLRVYQYGYRFPKAERYNLIISAIENFEHSNIGED